MTQIFLSAKGNGKVCLNSNTKKGSESFNLLPFLLCILYGAATTTAAASGMKVQTTSK